jgi:predicted nucleic acid-binding protein
VIFVDTNVFMYAVGREHPLRAPAADFFVEAVAQHRELCTSAEVLQELLHAYLPVSRMQTLAAAFELATRTCSEVWSVEPEDVHAAHGLVERHPGLGARDLLHLACCQRRGVSDIKTYDRALAASMSG